MDRFLLFTIIATVPCLPAAVAAWHTENAAWLLVFLPAIFLMGVHIGIEQTQSKILGRKPTPLEEGELFDRIFD